MRTIDVVIPAHNEEAVVETNLRRLTANIPTRSVRIFLIANGCTDATAERARTVPGVQVVELHTASKTAALNAGDELASNFPRIYMDADVQIDGRAILELAAALSDHEQARVASPRPVFDTTGAHWAVKAYHRVLQYSTYYQVGHIGSGVYGFNEAGRKRFGKFPDVVADDRFAQLLFAVHERISIQSVTVKITTPQSYRALLRRGVRVAVGNIGLSGVATDQGSASSTRTAIELLSRAARHISAWPAIPVYIFTYVILQTSARYRIARGLHTSWGQDHTSRQAHKQ